MLIFFLNSDAKIQLVMKKSDNLSTYPNPTKNDPTFKEEVFKRAGNKIPNLGMYFEFFSIFSSTIKPNPSKN